MNCVYFVVAFRNINIFGNSSFHDGVFQRYRYILHSLTRYLKESKCIEDDNTEVDYIPILADSFETNDAIEVVVKDKVLTSTLEIIDLEEYGLRKNLRIFKDAPEVCAGLKRVEDQRLFHHLGESNYLAYVCACQVIGNVDTIIDLGVGSGNTARLAISRS